MTVKMPAKLPRRSAPKDARRLARLVAVQALYQADSLGQSAVLVLKEFEQHRLTHSGGHMYLIDPEEATVLGTVDMQLMRDVVALALQHRSMLEPMVAANIPADWEMKRIEKPILMILLAGLAELFYQPQTPTGMIINDYVDVAHAFYTEKEPGLINAILDKVAKQARS